MKDSHAKATPDHLQNRATKRGDHSVPTDHRPPLDVEGAAAYLGTSVRHVRRLRAERRVPYLKLRGRLLFLPADLDAYLDACRVEAEPWDAA